MANTFINFFLLYLKKESLVMLLPAHYFFLQFVFVWFRLPYFWFGELVIIFVLIILFLYAEINNSFNTSFSRRHGVSITAESVCKNVILIFFINAAFTWYLRFFNSNLLFDYNWLNYTESIYLGSSVVSDFFRIFIAILFIVSMWYSLSYTKFKKSISYEFYIFLGLLCAFTLLCVDCKNLFLFFLLVEAISFLLIGLVCFSKTKTSFEVALKFFILSGLFTLVGFFGCAIIYGALHTLDYRAIHLISYSLVSGVVTFSDAQLYFLNFGIILVYIAVLFKLGSFPFHTYVADFASESFYPLLFFF